MRDENDAGDPGDPAAGADQEVNWMSPVFKERRRLRPEDLARITRVLGAAPEGILQQLGDALSTGSPAPPALDGGQRELLLSRFEESRQRIREAIARRATHGRKTVGGSSKSC